MKTLLFLLLPFLSIAQNQFPDTLFLVDGRIAPCLITSIDENKIFFNYGNNQSEIVVIKALQRVSLESFGTIYLSSSGYNTDEDRVEDFIRQRLDKIIAQQEVNEELQRLSLKPVEKTEYNLPPEAEIPELQPEIKCKHYKKWSFGILYVPYFSGTNYRIVSYSNGYNPPGIYIYNIIENEINMEAQLSYGITPELRATFDAGYTSSFEEERSETHYSNLDYSNDYGVINTIGLKLLDFNLGLKYYFGNFISDKVNIYALAGFGKQIAFAKNEHEDLYPGEIEFIEEDNIEEFTEELNSPWHFNLGFGAEYFFNESLSLTSNIRILYSSASGKYNYRYVYETESRTRENEYTKSDFITRIGLGLNFYF